MISLDTGRRGCHSDTLTPASMLTPLSGVSHTAIHIYNYISCIYMALNTINFIYLYVYIYTQICVYIYMPDIYTCQTDMCIYTCTYLETMCIRKNLMHRQTLNAPLRMSFIQT